MSQQGANGHRSRKACKRAGLSLQAKIDSVEKYISQNNTSRYLTEARQILDSLEKEAAIRSTEREQSIKSLNEEEKAKKEAERQYAALVKRQAERARIEGEKQNAVAAMAATQGRFVPTGESSVIDKKTGLTWSLLDSQRELGVCVDHRTARRYVKELRNDGHDDWRLPTSAELAGIYKNKPYFPNSGAEWYWTSEIFRQRVFIHRQYRISQAGNGVQEDHPGCEGVWGGSGCPPLKP